VKADILSSGADVFELGTRVDLVANARDVSSPRLGNDLTRESQSRNAPTFSPSTFQCLQVRRASASSKPGCCSNRRHSIHSRVALRDKRRLDAIESRS